MLYLNKQNLRLMFAYIGFIQFSYPRKAARAIWESGSLAITDGI